MTPGAFRASLSDPAPPAGLPPAGLPPALLALWHASRGAWEAAHGVVQGHEGEAACDWVHAHLHRIEGDAANAAYWYRRAGRPVPDGPLAAERDAMIEALATA